MPGEVTPGEVMPGEGTPPAGRELLAGKVVVVTAAAGTGIGSAAARRCLDEGAVVVLSDRHAVRLGELHEELSAAHGGRVWAVPCDVTSEGDVQALTAAAVGHCGRIDVLMNNAGLGGTAAVPEMTDAEWARRRGCAGAAGGRRPRRPAAGVPVQPRRHDLRRVRRDPAQHPRRAGARAAA